MDFSLHEQRTGQAARRLRHGDRDVQLRSQGHDLQLPYQ
jgi:hypothetical protein